MNLENAKNKTWNLTDLLWTCEFGAVLNVYCSCDAGKLKFAVYSLLDEFIGDFQLYDELLSVLPGSSNCYQFSLFSTVLIMHCGAKNVIFWQYLCQTFLYSDNYWHTYVNELGTVHCLSRVVVHYWQNCFQFVFYIAAMHI